ncbi:hypothetical protein ACIBG0_36805 [Nocardia sp. NPDC050630]|uniref:hypothetical protein n=1 Tax=Nocardia sp. NPDC050630 TaxID=3364321 RepID=UPI0037BCD4CB
MASEAAPSATPSSSPGEPRRSQAVGLVQRLAYLLVALAMNRAARQIRERQEALSRIPDGDDAALARHAEKVTAQRAAAETRLRGLSFAAPREYIAAALVDALTWSDSSPIAAKALEDLVEFYDREFGLKINPSGRTLTVDPDYPASDIQTAMEDNATWLRQQSAAAAVTTLITLSPLPAPVQSQVNELVTAWSGPHMDSTALTPAAIAQRRDELGAHLENTPLSDHDRAEALFLVDYLTARVGDQHHHSVDLLDTAPVFVPTPAAQPSPNPATASYAADPATTPSPTSGQPEQPVTQAPSASTSASRSDPAAGSFPSEGGGSPQAAPRDGGAGPDATLPQDNSGPPTRPPAAVADSARADAPNPAQPPRPDAVDEASSARADAVGVDRAELTGQLREYLANIKKLHGIADALCDDLTLTITDDMHQLTDALRIQRHQLLDLADHGPGLAPIERTQIRAVLYDIDTGKTELPTLLWVEESSKRSADEYLHRARGREIAATALARVTETLDNAKVFAPTDPPEMAWLPFTVRAPLQTMLDACREETGPVEQRRDQYFSAADKLGQHLSDLGVDEDTRDRIATFIHTDMPNPRFAQRPDRVARRFTAMLADTGVLITPDHEAVTASLQQLSEIIEAVAAGTGRRDRLLRDYQAAMDTLGQHLVAAGAEHPIRSEIRSTIDNHARDAAAHAVKGSDRRARWAERAVSATEHPRTQGPSPNTSEHPSTSSASGSDTRTTRQRTYNRAQRSKKFWQQHFRVRPDTNQHTRA